MRLVYKEFREKKLPPYEPKLEDQLDVSLKDLLDSPEAKMVKDRALLRNLSPLTSSFDRKEEVTSPKSKVQKSSILMQDLRMI